MQCSGHPGNLELIVPTYNALVMDVLVKILKMNCFNCHRLRIKKDIVEKFQDMIVLMKNGMVTEAYEYWKIDPEI